MKKYLWSTVDGKGRRLPFVILQCSDKVAKEIDRKNNENLWKFIADRLHEKYPEKFPDWFNEHGNRNVFWYNNVLEEYNNAYRRLVDEMAESIISNNGKRRSKKFMDELDVAIMSEVGWQIHQDLEELPVFKL